MFNFFFHIGLTSGKTFVKEAVGKSDPISYSVEYGGKNPVVSVRHTNEEKKFIIDQFFRKAKRWGGIGLMGAGGLGLLNSYLNPEEKDEEGNVKPSALTDYLPWAVLGGLGAYSRFTTPPVDTAGSKAVDKAMLDRLAEAVKIEEGKHGVNTYTMSAF